VRAPSRRSTSAAKRPRGNRRRYSSRSARARVLSQSAEADRSTVESALARRLRQRALATIEQVAEVRQRVSAPISGRAQLGAGQQLIGAQSARERRRSVQQGQRGLPVLELDQRLQPRARRLGLQDTAGKRAVVLVQRRQGPARIARLAQVQQSDPDRR